MTSTPFTVKRGDVAQVLTTRLTANGDPFDLTGATVVFHARRGAKSISGTAVPAEDQEADTGVVSYTTSADDLDPETTPVGDYRAEWEVTIGGQTWTFPNDGYDVLRVLDQVA